MLTMQNNFASQMQDKVTRSFINRTYDLMHKVEPNIEDKIRKAQSRIDTGLKKQATHF